MPKEERNKLLKRLVKEFHDMGNSFSTDEKIIKCKSCDKIVHVDKKFNMTQHIKTATHIYNLNKFKGKKASGQLFIAESFQNSVSQSDKQIDFNRKLCKALVEANIPLKKLNNSSINSFLKEFTTFGIGSFGRQIVSPIV